MFDLYRSQRAMRAMRQTALQRGHVAILDVGTSKIACLVLAVDGATPPGDGVGHMAGGSSFRIVGAAVTRSRGMRFGEIEAMHETERAIRTVVQGAQKAAQVRVDHVIAAISGGEARSYGVAGETDLGGEAVEEQDVARVLAACDVPDFGEGREVLHAQPVNFALDHRSGMNDPRGQVGERLACDMHMLTVESHVVQNLIHCIRRCDLELAGLASAAYASGLASLVEDERELGAACIDMGGGATGISVFWRKHLIYADAVPMGGDQITGDIAKCLQVPLATAERLKTLHGGAVATSMDDGDMIPLGGDSGDWERDRRTVSRAELIGIMRPRIEEILDEVRTRLDAAGFETLPSQAIVATGGGSQIPGLDTLAPQFFGQQIRVGRPRRVAGLPEKATGAAFSGAVGLCLFAADPQDEWWDFEIPAATYPARSLRRAFRWFKDNW